MKKVVYLAPIFLLSFLGKNALAGQVEHVNSLDGAVEQTNEASANTQQNMLGKGVAASQVEHVSSLNGAVEQMNVASANTQQNMQIKNKQPVYPIELEEKAYMDDTYMDDTSAETSTVRSVSAAPRTTNQSAAVQSPKISNINDAQAAVPVVINNPANNKVHVHYIDSNGNAVDNSSHDYDIDATKTGQASYTVPSGYQLNYPDGKYTVSGGVFNGTNLKGNVDYHDAILGGHLSSSDFGDGARRFYGVAYQDGRVYVPANEGGEWLTNMSQYNITYYSTDEFGNQYYVVGSSRYTPSTPGVRLNIPNNASPNGFRADITNLSVYGDNFYILVPHDQTNEIEPAYDEQHLPVAFVDSNNNIVGMIQNYTGKVGTTQNVSLTVPTGYKLADGASLPTSVTFQNSTNPLLVKVVPSGKTQSISTDSMRVHFVDQSTGKAVGGDYTISINDNDSYYYQTPEGYGADHNGYRTSVSTSTEYTGLSAINMTYPDGSSISLSMSNNAIKQMYDYFGKDADVAIGPNAGSGSQGATTVAVYAFDNPSNDKRVVIDPDDNISEWQRELYKTVSYSNNQFSKGSVWLLSPKTTQVTTSRRFTDNYHTISGNTVTVPVHKTNSFSFADNSGNVKSYSGNTVDVILQHQTKRIDPNNSSLDLAANNQLHLINTSQAQPKQSTANFKVGYLLDLVTNNKIIDTNNVQALNNTKIFTVNPSLPIGYDSLNTKLLTLNL